MSVKRSRQVTFNPSRPGSDEPSASFAFGKAPVADPEKTWEEAVAGQPDGAFVPYTPQAALAKGALILHSTFGKGVVIGVEPSRIEVLFSDGRKKLGHKA